MIEFLFALNLIVLVLVYRLLVEKVGRVISVFYGAYTGVFVVLKPALAYYAGILYPFSTNDSDAMTRLLVGSLIFLAVQWLGVRFLRTSCHTMLRCAGSISIAPMPAASR